MADSQTRSNVQMLSKGIQVFKVSVSITNWVFNYFLMVPFMNEELSLKYEYVVQIAVSVVKVKQ